MSYYELEIAFNEINYESIYNLLYLYHIKSILEDNGTIRISLPKDQLNALKQIKNELIDNETVTENNLFLTKFENLDWNKEWEKTIEPVYIKDKIIIYPSWKKNQLENTKNKILIEIDPKISFGTGHNETTQLILELMCDYITPKDRAMLDYGCGTGTLAIAGIKLGVENAYAVDIDQDSIENAKEYLKINNVDKSISLYKADITEAKEENFDIICANITSDVILDNIKSNYNKFKPGGKLFINGILTDETEELRSELGNNNFEIKEIRSKTGWSGIYSVKNL
ncbi:MAG TPA: 50S ribosomal protein L11 methyltransferase [Ignavibacteria bacterium]|jgi:ribosomal protein L11 methyltransferase